MTLLSFDSFYEISMPLRAKNRPKKIYCVRYETGFIADVARFVKDKQNIYMFLGEFCILILHPTILFKGIKVTFF